MIIRADARRIPLPDCSVDAILTDPPYSLAFMGRDWDTFGTPAAYQAWCATWAAECFRVLKPGGWLAAFGSTRTAHRMVCAIEDTGFEIRDTIDWIYTSGFPKSLNISKAIDKQRDDTPEIREVCRWLRDRIDAHPSHTVATIAAAFGFNRRMVEHWAARDTDSQPSLPTVGQWAQLRDLLGLPGDLDDQVTELNERKGEFGEAWHAREVTGTYRPPALGGATDIPPKSRDGLARDLPASELAAKWEGWGTALKPAHEPVTVARKPPAGTVTANVVEYGTGAMNIAACKVAGPPAQSQPANTTAAFTTPGDAGPRPREYTDAGRWPPNVVLSHAPGCQPIGTAPIRTNSHYPATRPAGGTMSLPGHAGQDGLTERRPQVEHVEVWECQPGCPVAELDGQAGQRTSGANPATRGASKFGQLYQQWAGAANEQPRRGRDSGAVSRCFPVFRWSPKASAAERPAADDGTGHPTVKPLGFMCWLVRLFTLPGAIILDPFAGSGTTGEACVIEGRRFILLEKDPASVTRSAGRLARPIQPALFPGTE